MRLAEIIKRLAEIRSILSGDTVCDVAALEAEVRLPPAG
jgi:hypothetical protein